jgi:hypothetical protein
MVSKLGIEALKIYKITQARGRGDISHGNQGWEDMEMCWEELVTSETLDHMVGLHFPDDDVCRSQVLLGEKALEGDGILLGKGELLDNKLVPLPPDCREGQGADICLDETVEEAEPKGCMLPECLEGEEISEEFKLGNGELLGNKLVPPSPECSEGHVADMCQDEIVEEAEPKGYVLPECFEGKEISKGSKQGQCVMIGGGELDVRN